MRVSREDFELLTSESVPGPSPQASRSANTHPFKIPLKYNDLSSRNADQHRLLNVFLAIVCNDVAWLIIDFARLMQFTVCSLDHQWTQEDLQPVSTVCLTRSSNHYPLAHFILALAEALEEG